MEASSLLTFAWCPATARPISRPVTVSGANILSDVPYVQQGTDYSCGAASLQAVLSYWGTDVSEEYLMERLNTSPDHGTDAHDIVRVARELGFHAYMEDGLTVDDLAASIREGVPVIVGAQAWAEEQGEGFRWADDWDHGHYMVVIGVDGDRIYLEDPALKECREVLPVDEFNERWHNYMGRSLDDPEAVRLHHMGIFISAGER